MMKKMTMLVAVILMAVATTYGQGVQFGVKGGVNLAKLDMSNAGLTGESNRTGYHFGVYARLKLPGGIGIQPEAYYSVQGAEFSTGDINMNYLQVPILLVFSPIPLINFHIGPQFGILLDAESDTGGVVRNAKEDFKSGDFSIAAGAGLDLPMGLNLTLRYVRALSDARAVSGSSKSSMIQISVGYKLFGLGK